MEFNSYREANVYSIPIYKQTISTAGPADIFGILASTSPVSRVEVLAINLSVSSSAVSGTPQALALQLLRGSTASSTSAAITPVNLRGWSGAPSAGSSATGPSSGIVSTASASQIWADSMNTAIGWTFPPAQDETGLCRPVLASGQRLHLRLDTPQVALVLSGNVTIREIGGGNAS